MKKVRTVLLAGVLAMTGACGPMVGIVQPVSAISEFSTGIAGYNDISLWKYSIKNGVVTISGLEDSSKAHYAFTDETLSLILKAEGVSLSSITSVEFADFECTSEFRTLYISDGMPNLTLKPDCFTSVRSTPADPFTLILDDRDCKFGTMNSDGTLTGRPVPGYTVIYCYQYDSAFVKAHSEISEDFWYQYYSMPYAAIASYGETEDEEDEENSTKYPDTLAGSSIEIRLLPDIGIAPNTYTYNGEEIKLSLARSLADATNATVLKTVSDSDIEIESATIKDAGTYNITSSYTAIIDGRSYPIKQYAELEIEKAELTDGGTDIAKIYNGTKYTTIEKATVDGVFGKDAVNVNYYCVFDDSKVGDGLSVTVTPTLTGAQASNYKMDKFTVENGVITPADIIVKDMSVADKIYDGTTAATVKASFAYLDAKGEEQSLPYSIGLSASDIVANFSDANVGADKSVIIDEEATKASFVENINLTFEEQESLVGTIKPKLLTVTTKDVTMYAGHELPTLEPIITGFVEGESGETLAGFVFPVVSTYVTKDSPAGTVAPLEISGGSAYNYDFVYSTNKTITVLDSSVVENYAIDYSTEEGEDGAIVVNINGATMGETKVSVPEVGWAVGKLALDDYNSNVVMKTSRFSIPTSNQSKDYTLYAKLSDGTILSTYVNFSATEDVTTEDTTTEEVTTEESTTAGAPEESTTAGAPEESTTEEVTTTETPTTEAPTTEAPTTEEPTTEAPTTEAPTTEEPTTEAPTTEAPTTEAPTTEAPTTEEPTTEEPTTEDVTTEEPTTEAPTTEEPTTEDVTTEEPTTEDDTTEDGDEDGTTDEDSSLIDKILAAIGVTTQAPTTTTQAPTTTTQAPADTVAPEVTVTKSTTKATNKAVTLTVKATDNKAVTSLEVNGKAYTVQDSVNVDISSNQNVTVIAKDAAGNTTRKVVKVANIDKVKPVIKAKVTSAKNVKISVTDNKTAKAKLKVKYIKGKKGAKAWSKAKTLKKFTAKKNTIYTILCKDKAGNISSYHFKVTSKCKVMK